MIKIPVRYYYIYGKNKERIESNFHHIDKIININPEEAALILVDIWNETALFPENTFSQRARKITLNKIVPVVDAARMAGIIVIHAPSPEIARKYPQCIKFECDKESNPIKNQSTDWPPIEFLKREGKYCEFSRIKIPISDEDRQKLTIDESIEPLPQDFVVTTGEHLHRLLRAKKILHLFYAGFYVNMCIQYRDYGLREMEERGYNIILLRNCTTAIEAHDTVDNLLITELSIRHIEMLHGFTAISEDFIEACRNYLKRIS